MNQAFDLNHVRSERGQALLQVLVTVGVMGTLMMTFMQLNDNQRRSNLALQQKLASLDVARVLKQALQSGDVCEYQVKNPVPPPLNPADFESDPRRVLTTLPGIKTYGDAQSSYLLEASATRPASTLDDALRVSRIELGEVTCDGGCGPDTNVLNAKISVYFDQTRLVHAVAPAQVPVTLQLTGPAGAKTIDHCFARTPLRTVDVESEDETCGGWTGSPTCPDTPATVVATCPPGFTVSGCGYVLSTWNPQPPPTGPISRNDPHGNSPDSSKLYGNGCSSWAGGAPGCGVCFRAKAICIQLQ